MPNDEDAEFEFVKITPKMVAKRVICLAASIMRGDIESELAEELNEAKNRSLCHELSEWLRDERMWRNLSQEEKKLLKKTHGSWSRKETINASWRQETIATLLWALDLMDDLPPYDEEASHLAPLTPLMRPTEMFIATARLRDSEEIDEARDVAESWLWRARSYDILRNPGQFTRPPNPRKIKKYIADSAAMQESEGRFKMIDGDYPAFGKPYRDLTVEEYHQAHSIAVERLYGLNWLCGYAKNWDEVPTDT